LLRNKFYFLSFKPFDDGFLFFASPRLASPRLASPRLAEIFKSAKYFFAVIAFCILTFLKGYSQECAGNGPFSVIWSNQTFNAPQTFVNQNIRVVGTVNFSANAPITLNGCTVFMEGGAVININGCTFIAQQTPAAPPNVPARATIFRGCSQMWNSININQNGTIQFSGCSIRDSRMGIRFQNGFNNANSFIIGNLFSFNSISIDATGVNNLSFSAFRGNNFVGKLPSIFGNFLPPHLNTDPVIGFKSLSSSGVLGSSGAENTFTRFSAAMQLDFSNLTINNCRFSNNLENTSAAFNGIGIRADNSTVTIGGLFSRGRSCTFAFNNTGIVSTRTIGLSVKEASFFHQGLRDVAVLNSTNPMVVNIENDSFIVVCPTVGSVFVERSAQPAGANNTLGAVHTTIKNNITTISDIGADCGIWVNDMRMIKISTQAGAFDQMIIANNQITNNFASAGVNTKPVHGILVQWNTDGTQISGNIINYPSQVTPTSDINSIGIQVDLNNGFGNVIGPDNQVTSRLFTPVNTFRSSWMRCGIHIGASQNVQVCKNDIDQTFQNIHISGDCSSGEIGRNIIRSGGHGLIFFSGDASLRFPNNHNFKLNEWVLGSTYLVQSATYAGGFVPPNLRWLVEGSEANCNSAFRPNNTNPANWFPNPSPVSNNCMDSTKCSLVQPPEYLKPPVEKLGEEFVKNPSSFPNAAQNWDYERKMLIQMIRFNPTTIPDNIAQNYFTNKIGSNIWKFSNAESLLQHSSDANIANSSQYEQHQAAILSLNLQLKQLEIQEGLDTTTVSLNIQNGKTTLLANISAEFDALKTLNAGLNQQRYNKLQQAKIYIAALPETTVYESNTKAVMLLMVKNYLNETWVDADSVKLRQIAYSCPAVAGEAVLYARTMLPMQESAKLFHDGDYDPLCMVTNRNSNQNGDQKYTPFDVVAFPNPSNSSISLAFNLLFQGDVEIYNVAARLVWKKKVVATNIMDIDVSNWDLGIYNIKLTTETGVIRNVRFSVIK
jgi:Secretion system C-terminal sorting domain